MPLSPVSARYTASTAGLITEGNELTAIENSNLAESNYELLHDGTRRRRRPLIEEKASRSHHRFIDEGDSVSSHLWQTPGREEEASIVVEEVNGHIRFYWLDHNDVTHISDDANLLEDELRLELWGIYNNVAPSAELEDKFTSGRPAVYTEGNGSLYIFNRFTGTIRVDLVDPVTRRLRFAPVGTWVRDFEGLDETSDPFSRPVRNDDLEGYNGVPVLDPELIDSIHEDLDNRRAYNLTNQGWPEIDLARFAEDSALPFAINFSHSGEQIARNPTTHVYPAFMDRYIDGRVITDAGTNFFEAAQILEAAQRKGEPSKGARIGSSDYSAAGTLSPVPIRVSAIERNPPVTISPVAINGNTLQLDIELDEPFFHSAGRPVEDLAAFIHSFVFSAEQDGKRFVGGVSGVFDAVLVNPNGRAIRVELENIDYREYTNFQVNSLYLYPAPIYTPHRVNTPDTYDYRRQRRPSAGAWYAGRLWQFGDEHNRVYFSQLIPESSYGRDDVDVTRESMCYTANSPTDPDDNAIVATDGGYVMITDSGVHLQGVVLHSSLLISTDNGVWEIKGSDRSGIFTPDGFAVRRLSRAEVLGHKAMIVMDSEVHVATGEGIMRIFPDDRTGVLRTEIITHNTIKSEYDTLIDEDREVIGAYDPDSRVIRWVFPLNDVYTSNNSTSACPMLSWSLQHSAWFRYDFGFGAAIADMFVLPYTVKNPTYNRFRYLVTSLNLTGVLEGDLFVEWGIEAELGETGPNQWVEIHDEMALFADFLDVFQDPTDRAAPEAFMLTNYQLLGGGNKWQTINYLTAYNREVTTNMVPADIGEDGEVLTYRQNINGSTLVQALWDWFTEGGRGKHTKPQETYRYRRSFFPDDVDLTTNPRHNRAEDLLVAKQKIRGRGREFRLRWSAPDHFDSHIVGWTIDGLVNVAT